MMHLFGDFLKVFEDEWLGYRDIVFFIIRAFSSILWAKIVHPFKLL